MEKCLELQVMRTFGWVIDMEIGAELMLRQSDDVSKLEVSFEFRGNPGGGTQSF